MFPGDFTIKLRLEHRPPSVLDADVSARRMKLVRLHNLTPIPLAVFLEKEKNGFWILRYFFGHKLYYCKFRLKIQC